MILFDRKYISYESHYLRNKGYQINESDILFHAVNLKVSLVQLIHVIREKTRRKIMLTKSLTVAFHSFINISRLTLRSGSFFIALCGRFD
jgi:hypothetical protein